MATLIVSASRISPIAIIRRLAQHAGERRGKRPGIGADLSLVDDAPVVLEEYTGSSMVTMLHGRVLLM